MKYIFLLLIGLFVQQQGLAQKYGNKDESLLSSKKWTVVESKGKEAYFETGEELAFDIDKKFRIKKNNSDRVTGTWFLDEKYLLLTIEAAEGMGHGMNVPKKMKIMGLSKDELKLQFKTEKNQKVTLH